MQFPSIAARLGDNPTAEPLPEPGELHPILKLAAESPAYTFLAGVLVFVWGVLLEYKIRQHRLPIRSRGQCV